MLATAKSVVLTVCLVFAFNEYFIYYVVISSCQWPEIKEADAQGEKSTVSRVLVLSDTHLLGKHTGHWFDKLRREWQMRMSFQATVQLHSPDVVFILGDLFDEGKWVGDNDEWMTYVKTARKLFNTTVDLHVVIGNHDVGFHHDMTETKVERFFSEYQSKHFQLIEVNERILFIMGNSMALENDGCSICEQAKMDLQELLLQIDCSSKRKPFFQCKGVKKLNSRTKPILLQHFPLYRESDELCEGSDPDKAQVITTFREGWDCLSKTSSEMLMDRLTPRLIMSGHTHDYCKFIHQDGTVEISVPSFSWRNRNNPSSIMLSVTENSWKTSKCYLPQESTVISFYIVAIIIICLCRALTSRKRHLTGVFARKFA